SGHRRRDAARPLPVPRLGLEHAAADRADDQRRVGAVSAADPGVVQRLARRREREAIGARSARRAAERVRHLGADPAAEALGVDQGDRADRRDAAADPLPVRLDAGAERADDPEPGNGDRLHAPAVLEAMKRDSVSKDVKCGARSADSSIAMPKRSSIAIESSMKSSESRPIELSMPFGRVVSRVKSTARRGSNLSRVTRIVLSSSNTSLGSITLLVPVESGTASAPFTRDADGSRRAVLAR